MSSDAGASLVPQFKTAARALASAQRFKSQTPHSISSAPKQVQRAQRALAIAELALKCAHGAAMQAAALQCGRLTFQVWPLHTAFWAVCVLGSEP